MGSCSPSSSYYLGNRRSKRRKRSTGSGPRDVEFAPVPRDQSLQVMAQYIYTMNRVGKVVPPKRVILRDISLSFFPGAKIGVLGLNGSGKSTLLKIMGGTDKEIEGEARPQPGTKIGMLAQEPNLDAAKDVRGNVIEGVGDIQGL